MATNSSGGSLGGATFLPFGETRSNNATFGTDRLFTGQRLDSRSGLYLYNARYCDASLGRFASADTIIPSFRDPQVFNRYSYVRDNPLNHTDPTGHVFETPFDLFMVVVDAWALGVDPTWERLGLLALDLGAAGIPGVPAVAGLVAGATKIAAQLAHLAKGRDLILDLAKSIQMVDFRSAQLLHRHWIDHGLKIGFKYATEKEYLKGARRLVTDASKDKSILVTVDNNSGAVLYFRKETNEFLTMDKNGVIRTYYAPYEGSEKSLGYWNAQRGDPLN